MRKITKRDVCLSVPDRWERQYGDYQGETRDRKRAILDRLMAMPVADLTPEKINAVIGNESWTSIECDVCQCSVDEAVTVESYYASDILTMCEKCVEKLRRVVTT